MNKVDYKNQDKEFYKAQTDRVSEVRIPDLKFLMLGGTGDPNNSALFKEACEALLSMSYKIKFSVKKGELGIDYSVMPLEGLWWVDDGEFNISDKSNWKWTLLVRQPEFVTQQHVADAIEEVSKKKQLTNLSDISLNQYDEGLSAQILHGGPYSEEQPTIDKLHDYIREQGYKPHGKHHEIYLNDPTKTNPYKLKTIIRQPIK